MAHSVIRKVVSHRWWQVAMLLLTVVAGASILIPPSAFLQSGPLIYDARSETFLYTRHAASIADVFLDCDLKENFASCRRIDDNWPLVWTSSRTNVRVDLPSGEVMECNRPPAGASAFLNIQWEPFEIVRYPADSLVECMESGYPVALSIHRRMWLFGMLPLQRPIRSRYLFPGIFMVDGEGQTTAAPMASEGW